MLTDTRAMTAEYRLQQWAGILQKQKESGLNIKLYCEEIGIKEHRYFYWQRRLREASNSELTKAQRDITGMIPARSDSPVMWAGVDINALDIVNSSTESSSNIKISRNGWTVTVAPGFDAGTLTETLKALSRACC